MEAIEWNAEEECQGWKADLKGRGRKKKKMSKQMRISEKRNK